MGFAGQQAPNYGMNNMLLFMRGPDDGQMRVALREGSGIHLAAFRERLRKVLPEQLDPLVHRACCEEKGCRPTRPSSGPADDVRLRAGRHRQRSHELRLARRRSRSSLPAPTCRRHEPTPTRCWPRLNNIPALRDVQIQQTLDYPDRADHHRPPEGRPERRRHAAGRPVRAGDHLVEPHGGPQLLAGSANRASATRCRCRCRCSGWTPPTQVETVPLERVTPGVNLMVRDVARVGQGIMPGEYDRTSMQRYLSVTANVEGEDLGRAARQIERGPEQAGAPPRGVHVESRGQVAPDERDVRVAGHRPGRRRGRHPRAADRLFPVAAPGPGLHRRRARRAQRRGR